LQPILFSCQLNAETEPTRTRIGSGGLSVAQQLYNRFESAGKALKAGDIAIVDAAEYHNYQVCASIGAPPP
jgi:hypothetical protein